MLTVREYFYLVRNIKTDFKSILYLGTVSSLIGVHFNLSFNCCELPDFETSLLDMAELCTRENNMSYKYSVTS